METPEAPGETLLHTQKPDTGQHAKEVLLHAQMLGMCQQARKLQINFAQVWQGRRVAEGMVNVVT